MNDIDKMPVKCRDCPYWELAVCPWNCGDCTDRLKKPVSDFVSRQWLIDEYHRRHEGPPGGALKMIEEAPAADVEPVRHGQYIGTEFDGYADGNPVYYEWKCSECDCVFEDDEPKYRYCPHCGAKMDGGSD